MKNSSVSTEKIEENKKQFKSKLNEITTGNPKYKSKDQLDGIEKIKNLYNSREKVMYNKLNISATTWNEEFKLPDGSYSISDIQDYFEYILKKNGENIDNPSVKIYVNKIENRITFKIKTGYHLELLNLETMKSLGSTKNKITKNKNGENAPYLEITQVALVHCNIVNK